MKSNLILMLVGALGVAALMPLPAGAQTLAQAAPNQALGPEDVFWQSVGDWAACPICHRLIEAGDCSGLVERSLHTLLQNNPDMRGAEADLRD